MSDFKLVINSQRFIVDGPHATAQFCQIYQRRLEQISPYIIPSLPKPFCKHINELIPGNPCSIVGVIYKDLAKRRNILQDYKQIDSDSQTEDLFFSEDDKIYIEDPTGRLHLKNINIQEFVTGVIIGIHGTADHNKFHVASVHEPVFSPAPPLPSAPGFSILFISDLQINSKELFKTIDKKKLINGMKGATLCVLLGNNFEPPEKVDAEEMVSFEVKMQCQKNFPIQQLKSFLSVSSTKMIIMPGANDPTPIRLPQLPFHRCLINNDLYELATNPASFSFQDIKFLCGAGESPNDISKTTSLTFHEAQKAILAWKHYAPTAPDHISCVPLEKQDILVIDEMPNVFVCGLAESFEVSKYEETLVISVPSFAKSGGAVLLNLENGIAEYQDYSMPKANTDV